MMRELGVKQPTLGHGSHGSHRVHRSMTELHAVHLIDHSTIARFCWILHWTRSRAHRSGDEKPWTRKNDEGPEGRCVSICDSVLWHTQGEWTALFVKIALEHIAVTFFTLRRRPMSKNVNWRSIVSSAKNHTIRLNDFSVDVSSRWGRIHSNCRSLSISTTNTNEQTNFFRVFAWTISVGCTALLRWMDSGQPSLLVDCSFFSDDRLSFPSSSSVPSFEAIATFQLYWSAWIRLEIVTVLVAFWRSDARIDSKLFYCCQRCDETRSTGMHRELCSCPLTIQQHLLVQARSSSSTTWWCAISRSALASDCRFAEANDQLRSSGEFRRSFDQPVVLRSLSYSFQAFEQTVARRSFRSLQGETGSIRWHHRRYHLLANDSSHSEEKEDPWNGTGGAHDADQPTPSGRNESRGSGTEEEAGKQTNECLCQPLRFRKDSSRMYRERIAFQWISSCFAVTTPGSTKKVQWSRQRASTEWWRFLARWEYGRLNVCIEDRVLCFVNGEVPVFVCVCVYTRCTFYPSFCIFHSMIQFDRFSLVWLLMNVVFLFFSFFSNISADEKRDGFLCFSSEIV